MARSFRSWGWFAGALMSFTVAVIVSSGISTTATTSDFDQNRDRGWDDILIMSGADPMFDIVDLGEIYIREYPDTPFEWVGVLGRSYHDIAYRSANQPGQEWRVVADAYRHVDPGRRMI